MKPKPIKPRRMWASANMQTVSSLKGASYITRPVLVIDLSPESVDALIKTITRDHYEAGRAILAAIGIRPVKGGRK